MSDLTWPANGVVIVTHKKLDMDALLSTLLMSDVLRSQGYKGNIKVEFINPWRTYKDIKINSKNVFERVDGETVIHVDCAGAALDHHGKTYLSSVGLIGSYFKVLKTFPEWKRLICWTNSSDIGNHGEGLNLSHMIRSSREGGISDIDILRRYEEIVRLFIASEKAAILTIKRATVVEADNFDALTQMSAPSQVTVEKPYGKVGVSLVESSTQIGPLQSLLSQDYVVLISIVTTGGEQGAIRIYTQHGSGLDLRESGIVAAIRTGEAIARGWDLSRLKKIDRSGILEGAAWHAFQPQGEGRVINMTIPAIQELREKEQSKLSGREVVQIVEKALDDYFNR